MRVIAIVNQKGGCGKTTTAINLAAVCAKRGLRTLVVDMDPQSHCAAGLGVPDDALDNSIAKALLADLSRPFNRSSLVWEVARNLDLAPSTMSLAGLEAPGGGLHELEDRDRRLAQLLRHLTPHYDRCFIDCPPTIGLLTYNALRAAGEAIIPLQTEYFALRGAKKQWETIRHLVESVDHPIACYVLPSMFKEDQKVERDILDSIRRHFKGTVMPIVVHDRAEIREAAAFGQPVAEYAPKSDAAATFERVVDWLEEHPADPPTIEVEVKRAIVSPFARESATTGATSGAAMAAAAETRPVAAGSSSTSAGGRAAEMARKVRELAHVRSGIATGDARDAEHAKDSRADAPPAVTQPPAEVIDAARPIDVAVRRRVHPLVLRPDPPANQRPAGTHPIAAADATDLAVMHRAALIERKELPIVVAGAINLTAAHPSSIVRLFGVRRTEHGVLFVQPGVEGMKINVAGEFNYWSPTGTPLRYNRETGVFELLLPLPRGEHQYRLVVDGQWQCDPYNPLRCRNEFGEENNVVMVE